MTTPRHRVSAVVAQMRDQADAVAAASVWSMDAQDAAATLVELTKLEAQVTELKLRVAAQADDLCVGEDTGATSTASWWAHQTNQARPAAHGQIHLAHALTERAHVRAALAAGDLVLDQARAIITALAQLPDDLDPALVERAADHLVAEAADHDAKTLGLLGKRLLEVVAPDEADAHEARLLEQEEAAAAAACRLTMVDDGHGKTHGRFTLLPSGARC